MRRGEVWWASLGEPRGSGPGLRRPVVIVQADDFNESAIRTVLCVAVTSNLRFGEAPGNVRLSRRASGLTKESVANVSQVITVDKRFLTQRAGRLASAILRDIDTGLRLVLAL
ncbi:MAG: type II toxin-antitoxin system PemK/MazF family toxin [Steroidobacteraceae bacterium]